MKSIIYSAALVLGLSALFAAMASGHMQRAGGAVASASNGRLADLAALAERLPHPADIELPWAASDDPGGAPAVESRPTPPTEDARATMWQIGNTGGRGVSLRGDCIPAARLPGSIGDGEPVTVVASGEGRCAGWSLVQRGATGSWVEERFLMPPGAVVAQAPGPPPPAPSVGARSSASDARPHAPIGATLSVWIHGTPCATATVTNEAGESRYRVSVDGSAPCSPRAGDPAIFTADGLVLPAAARWQPGVVLELNLVPR